MDNLAPAIQPAGDCALWCCSPAHGAIVFPLTTGLKVPQYGLEWRDVPRGQYHAVGNYGVALPADLLVIDFDVYKPGGQESLNRFFSRYPNFRTRIVQSPRGGYHVYVRKPSSLKLRPQKQPLWPGVDFQSDGQYVVGPGTQTIETKDSAAGIYQLLGDAPIADAPDDFLAELEIATEKAITQGAETTLSMSEEFRLECTLADPAIEKQNGDKTTYNLACRGRDMGLPVDVVYQFMRDEWNPRCQPAWGDGELYNKVRNAFKYAKNAAGNKSPEAIFTPPDASEIARAVQPIVDKAPKPAVTNMAEYKEEQILQRLRPDLLQTDSKGNPIESLANIACLLKVDPAWRGRFRYNQFTSNLEFTTRPPWRKDQLNAGLSVEKRDIACMQVWFSTQRMEVPENKLVAAIEAVAEPAHPVKQYLESIVWDKVPRLDKILVDTLGVADNAYTRDVGKCLLIAICARVYEPGCKVDDVVIFEGAQGKRKSMWISVLGGEWSSTGQLIRGDKDTYQNLRGCLVVELPEINATFSKADFNWLKGILSTSVDVYRPSYARAAQKIPRESVFLGTINPGADRRYLKDDENRRYHPLACTEVNVELLKEFRDQYFAEALHRYRNNEPWWITDPEIIAMAKAEQERRREQDPLVEVLRDAEWLKPNGMTPAELYRGLGFNAPQIKSSDRRRVYAAMEELGYQYLPEPGSASGKWSKTKLAWSDVI